MRSKTLVLLLFAAQFGLQAQTYALKGINSFSSNGIKAILNNKEVVGYVLFYKTDKADSKNDNYGFDLLDENLNKVSTVKVILPRNAMLLQPVYNGEVLGTGAEPKVDIAVDPIDGTRLLALGKANSLATVAMADTQSSSPSRRPPMRAMTSR